MQPDEQPAPEQVDRLGQPRPALPLGRGGQQHAEHLVAVGRPVPGPDTEAGPMIARNTLVRAVKE